jgi:crotonobetainyl-CoA:carnitine CoA-transferase CaiB-like acyl-CoA transferase
MVDAPLAGVRVVELARVLAGPWAGQILADLGAEVTKVENPDGGDDTRHWGPPFLHGNDGADLSSAYYHSTNRGKRSIALDFKKPEDVETVRQLVNRADIVIENFKVGGLKKYGLDWETLRLVNPKLVYCSITGFGQTGPYAPRAGYDFIIQGMSGLMSMTGEPDEPPQKSGMAVADMFTGLYAVIAIQAALMHVRAGGQGQHIDMSLLDTQSAIMSYHALSCLVSGKSPSRIGNAHTSIMPYDVLPVADGHVILAVGNDGQFERLCSVLNCPELAGDPRFSTNEARVVNRAALKPLLVKALKPWTKTKLLDTLDDRAVPAGPINSIAEMLEDPQIKARGLVFSLQDDDGNQIPSLASPMVFGGTPVHYGKASPRLGEHTDEIKEELRQDLSGDGPA